MKKLLPMALAVTALSTGCSPLREVRFDTIQNSAQARSNEIMKRHYENYAKREDSYTAEHLSLEVVEFDEETEFQRERIRVLENVISEIQGIEDVSIVLVENAAIVAISVIGEVGDTELKSIKNKIEQVIKETDISIRYVSVTAAPELIERINKLGSEGNKQINLTEIQQEIISNLRPLV